MELTIHVDPAERTVRFREVHALAAGDSCSVVLEGVRGADVAALRLALYRDAASKSPVASCPSFAPVQGHPNLATGDLRLDTAEMAAWFEAVAPAAAQAESGPGRSRPEDAAERAVRTDGWLVVSEPTRMWAACRVPVILRPGAGISDVVDPTSLQALVEGLVSAEMSEALASKADKATTLAGYGITDAATKSELDSVDQNVANAIFGVQSELSAKADLVDGKVPVAQLPSLALGETSDTAYPGDKGAANASGIAALKKSKQDALDAKQLSAVNSGITAEKISNMVTKDNVVPKGNGTETIATVAGKDIKAPASPVSSVNGKTGAVVLDAAAVGARPASWTPSASDVGARPDSWTPSAQEVGAFPASGGEVGSAESAGVIRLAATYFAAPVLEFKQSFSDASTLDIPNSAMYEQTGEGPKASIKKGGKEVATEDQLISITAQSAYPMTTVADGALKDRTVNHATAGGTFTFPERTGSNARDFVLVIDALSTAPTVTFPGSFTYVSEQDAADIWTAEAGKVNAWYFSEVADENIMVCQKAKGVVAQ